MTFTARQLQEKCQEQNSDLFLLFVELTKAFNTVSREGLWKIIAKYGCPDEFLSTVCYFRNYIMVCVSDQQELSNLFPITNGLKQGCCKGCNDSISSRFSSIHNTGLMV